MEEIIKPIYPHSATLFAAICACIFAGIGVFGNLITLLALLNNPTIREHATTAFIVSLSISDLLFCSISLPLTAVRYFLERWPFGTMLCKMFPVIFYGNVAVSLLSMVGITLNRYILITCHNRYSQIYKSKYIILQLIFVWAISFLLLLPPLLGIWGEMGLDKATFSCTILKKNGKSIKKMLFLVGFLLPCLVIIISYSCIYMTVIHQKKKLKSHNFQMVGKNVVINSTNSSIRKNREDHRLTLMMVTIFVCFLLSFLPLMLANVADDERKTSYPWLHIIASVMAWSSCVINPIIYAASNRNYRTAYYKIFAQFKCWGEPLSPISRKIMPQSNSEEFSGVIRSTPLFSAAQKAPRNDKCQTYSV